jgi:hypothetical protein
MDKQLLKELTKEIYCVFLTNHDPWETDWSESIYQDAVGEAQKAALALMEFFDEIDKD